MAPPPEAARLLFEAEGGAPSLPEKPGDDEIGDATGVVGAEEGGAPIGGARRIDRRPWIIGGLMTLVLGLLALAALPQAASPPPPPSVEAQDPAVVDAARQWLMLVDGGRWDDSYRATGAAFRHLNTARTFTSQEDSPTPQGYQIVKFRTAFANRADAVETVALDREGGRWRVVGVYVG